MTLASRADGPSRARRIARRVALGAGLLLVVVLGAGVVVGCVLSGSAYEGPPSDHFDGKHFRNLREVSHAGFGSFLAWQWNARRGPWDRRTYPPAAPSPSRVARGDLQVTFVNHATVLLQMDGVNVVTDPIWSDRASPFSFVGPRRYHAPGVSFEALPHIDVVLISHCHYDHMDLPTLRRLDAAFKPQFFVGLGNGARLRAEGFARVTELDWWQGARIGPEVELTAVPAQHFSNRGLFDRDRTLWLGYVVQGPAGAAYFAGDTGFGPHFARIRERFGPPRLAILPIGAFRPEWFMEGVHESPEQAVAAAEILGAGTALAIHFGTFALADDGQDEPRRQLESALARRGTAAARFWTLRPGERRTVPQWKDIP